MSLKSRYECNKEKLLNAKSICKENRELFKNFFEYEEYKLKRINGIPNIDDRSYKTLSCYIGKLRNVNTWFQNKPWKLLTKEEIRKVYDLLEEGKLKGIKGKTVKDKKSYYNKVFKSKPFELAGKDELTREVMEFYNDTSEQEVRFITEETFRKLVEVTNSVKQKLLLWLAFDIGENINSLLRLQKNNFIRQINSDTKEAEYIVNLPKEILKRSRKPRSEITNFRETVQFLDIILKEHNDNEYVFTFGHRQALKFIGRAVKIVNARCIPRGQKVTWKDLRSSMACHLLTKDWSRDEINARLGHKPSSRVLDRYVNYLALDRNKPKKKIHENNLREHEEEIENLKSAGKLQSVRIEKLKEDNEMMVKEIAALKRMNQNTNKWMSLIAENKHFRNQIAKGGHVPDLMQT